LSVALLVAQTPLLTLHLRLSVPTDKPMTPLVPRDGVSTIPEPDRTVQAGFPTDGMLPVNAVVGFVIQILCVGPVVAGVGTSSTWMLMLEVLEHTPFLSVHCNTLTPRLKLVTLVFERLGTVNVPPPVVTDQVPKPKVGELPASNVVGELTQIV